MGTQQAGDGQHLLAVEAGAEVEVLECLLPGGVRAATGLPVRPGSRWRLRLNGRTIVLLQSLSGRMVGLRVDEARYVRVRRLAGPDGPAAAAAPAAPAVAAAPAPVRKQRDGYGRAPASV
jgi:hypothetical protein